MTIAVIIIVSIAAALLLALEILRTTKHGKLDHITAAILTYSNLTDIDNDSAPLDELRAKLVKDIQSVSGKIPKVPVVENLEIPAEHGDIPVRIYRPENPVMLPVILYFHGGGFVKGCNDSVVNICSYLQMHTSAVVVSVDYRLAPEHPFPAAVEDCLAVMDWILRNSGSIGIDPARIITAGDSAGGTLSAVLSQIYREKIFYQILLYPGTDMKSLNSQSYNDFADGFMLTKATIEWFRRRYLPDKSTWADPKASPLFEENLKGVPPALVITAEFDVLRDEGKEYADKLSAAGTDVEYINVEGVIHGFLSMTGVLPKARGTLSLIGKRINKMSESTVNGV